ncbi:hypothetical protein NPIL_126311 [Nephila pilipes]|uniref:Uncharacterized protein n=1 Tax=Nephila pilipes TaxID=299642 RepID=A0A8X6TBB7_NEPPI|nr:hypothetical protein NPIL_126311 [Nephila pilipes]
MYPQLTGCEHYETRYEAAVKELLVGVDYKAADTHKCIRKGVPNGGDATEIYLKTRDKFRITTYYTNVDKLEKKRRNIYKEITERFSFNAAGKGGGRNACAGGGEGDWKPQAIGQSLSQRLAEPSKLVAYRRGWSFTELGSEDSARLLAPYVFVQLLPCAQDTPTMDADNEDAFYLSLEEAEPNTGHATTGYPHVNPTEVQLPIMSQKEPSSSLTDTLENLRNPQVKEIFELLDQAIAIATSDLSKYQKMRAILKIAGEDLGI